MINNSIFFLSHPSLPTFFVPSIKTRNCSSVGASVFEAKSMRNVSALFGKSKMCQKIEPENEGDGGGLREEVGIRREKQRIGLNHK